GSASFSGILDPVGHSNPTTYGPVSVRDPGGSWVKFENSHLVSGSRTETRDAVVYPAGRPHQTAVADVDKFGTEVFETTGIIPTEGLPGSPSFSIFQTPDTPDYTSPLWPALLIEASPVRQVLGEMDDVFWVSAHGEDTDLVTED